MDISKQHSRLSQRTMIVISGVLGFWAVASGAFGAHALKSVLSEYELSIWHTGVQYLFIHCVVLLVISLLPAEMRLYLKKAFISFACGAFVFSGSLQILALSGVKWLGAVTPIGGALMLLGWVLIVLAAKPLSTSIDMNK